jgi:acyl-CoA thioesterase II
MTVDDEPIQDDDTFVDRLRLRRLDRDIFTGWCHAGAPLRAFGGQVAAQALVAAGTTVEQPHRRLHSLHSYFLRPGRTTDHIVYLVDRPRDGRSFSTRRVQAVQYGETIFAMSASFAIPFEGPSHQSTHASPAAARAWVDSVPPPESIEPVKWFTRVAPEDDADRAAKLTAAGYPLQEFVDMRLVDPAFAQSTGRADQMAWYRSTSVLPDESLLHVCALTYFSDLSLVSTVLGHHGGREGTKDLDVTSIDHAMWFHQPFRADEWLLFVTDSPVSAAGRGFARGQFFRQDGALIASVAQEVLIRQSLPRAAR